MEEAASFDLSEVIRLVASLGLVPGKLSLFRIEELLLMRHRCCPDASSVADILQETDVSPCSRSGSGDASSLLDAPSSDSEGAEIENEDYLCVVLARGAALRLTF